MHKATGVILPFYVTKSQNVHGTLGFMVQLVGIVNVTPDSFSDGGLFLNPKQAIAQAEKLFADGAAIVDIGAESTRPRAAPLTTDEEWQRLEPVLKVLIPRFPGKISVDSYRPATIEKAFGIGQIIVNDITGLRSPGMKELIIKHSAICIIGHMPHDNIQIAHNGEPTKTIKEVKNYLLQKEAELIKGGLDPANIILDPCIGFGKTPELNRQLIEFAKYVPDKKVMIGYSRKRFLGEHRMELEPNLAAGKIASASGAAYLRVHDVAGHKTLVSERVTS